MTDLQIQAVANVKAQSVKSGVTLHSEWDGPVDYRGQTHYMRFDAIQGDQKVKVTVSVKADGAVGRVVEPVRLEARGKRR
jgi:hypothetical protein